MPVEKLFWDDPYAVRCDATVISVDGPIVTLDRTVAFGASGGQASDAATIAGVPVLEARCEALEIVYRLPDTHGLRVGDGVEVTIDPATRDRLRRLHMAAELVLELVYQRHGRPEKLGADISPGKARIDFAWEGSIAPILGSIAEELTSMIAADLPITSAFSDAATQRRYWEIEGFARVDCGGTHPRSTGEIGAVTLKRANPGAGVERIEIRLADE